MVGKLSKEQIAKIHELRKQGLSINKIAKIMKFHYNTVYYHLSPKYRKYKIEQVTRWIKKRGIKPKREYLRKYFMKRYHANSEFRAKVKQSMLRYHYKRQAEKRRLRNLYPDYDMLLKEYSVNIRRLGQKEAWKIFKPALDMLRERHGVNFPT